MISDRGDLRPWGRRLRDGEVGVGVVRASLRRGGRLVCVALPADGSINVPIFDTVLSGKSVTGSIVGTRNDLADVFALHAAGRTRVIAVERKLDEVNDSISDVLAGHIPARVVFQI